MTEEEIKARDILKQWADLEGHELCWHHPDILMRLCEVFSIPLHQKPALPPRCEFRAGCQNHEATLYQETLDGPDLHEQG